MKHKYISKQSNELLSWFRERDMNCFGNKEALKALPDSKESAVRELLSDMTKRGLLMRLKKGKYFIIPYEQDSDSFMPDWHLAAECLVSGTEYYIGYYSAMQILDLITQPSIKEQIVVSKQIRPSVLNIKNIPFQFIYHNENHFFGYKKTWIDSYNKVMCSDLEKTIIDCLYNPGSAGGIVEVAKAIYVSKSQVNFKRLMEYVRRFNSQAVIKRMGFLFDILEINTEIIAELQKLKTASYVLLDTELPKAGKMISEWSIQQNLEAETIKSAMHT